MKKPNYTIKSLSLALLITSCALTSFMGLNANPKRIDQAVLIFHKHVDSEDPSMHWDDFVKVIAALLQPTAFTTGATSLQRLAGQRDPKTVGGFLIASVANKMPPKIQKLINDMKTDQTKLAKLAERFKKSLEKARLTQAEFDAYINVTE